ncbi:MAG: hypothetical protein ACPL7K_08915, partial [Armatimonadota bacterium]
MPDYSWATVTEAGDFDHLWMPFDLTSAYIAEIRRREDLVQLETLRPRPTMGRGRPSVPPATIEDATVYLTYPLVPNTATVERFLRILLLHPAKVLWQVMLSPVHLDRQEHDALTNEIARCERILQEAHSEPAASTPLRTRAEALCRALFDQLMRLQDAP